jgi:hypothetical protein
MKGNFAMTKDIKTLDLTNIDESERRDFKEELHIIIDKLYSDINFIVTSIDSGKSISDIELIMTDTIDEIRQIYITALRDLYTKTIKP